MERDLVINGIHVVEHRFVPEEILEELRVRVVEPGFRFVSIRPRGPAFDQAFFLQWGRYLAADWEDFATFSYWVFPDHCGIPDLSRYPRDTALRRLALQRAEAGLPVGKGIGLRL